jgi:hypothetical protein
MARLRFPQFISLEDFPMSLAWTEHESVEPHPPFTEPNTIDDLFVTGMTVRRRGDGLQCVAWTMTLGGDGEPEERRIVLRFSMPERAARQLRADLINAFKTVN